MMQVTPLHKCEQLSKQYQAHIYLKDESKQQTGTFKDRRSALILKKAQEKKINSLILITSGNSGYSLACIASNKQVYCVIDKKVKQTIKQKLTEKATLIEVDLSKKYYTSDDLLALLPNTQEKILDVTNGYAEAYGNIITEIQGISPDLLILPVGSGESYVGLYQGLQKHKLTTQLVGVQVENKTKSYADKLHALWSPYTNTVELITKKGHTLIILTEEEIKKAYNKNKKQFSIEPSSGVIFGALEKLELQHKKVVLLNTGKGLF